MLVLRQQKIITYGENEIWRMLAMIKGRINRQRSERVQHLLRSGSKLRQELWVGARVRPSQYFSGTEGKGEEGEELQKLCFGKRKEKGWTGQKREKAVR